LSDGTPPTFESLYSVYTPVIRRLLRSQGVRASDLDDLLQETFVTVHRLLPGFEGRSSISTWLHAVTWRVAANYRRRVRRTVVSGGLEVAAPPDEHAAEGGVGAESYDFVEGEQRDLLALHDIGGLSISGLAELTGHARATVRNKLERGRATLSRRRSSGVRRGEAFERGLAARHAVPVLAVMSPDTRVLVESRTALTTVDDLVLVVWRGPCTHAALHEVIGLLLTQAHNRPAPIRYLSVVEPSSVPPDREGREMMLWAARQLSGRISAVAHWVEDSGRIAMIASIMNASLFLARSGFDPHYFTDLTRTLSWLAQFGPLDEPRVREQIDRMKALLAATPCR
jgi:RNA polymerase sigma-70 factor (ECF subfamily)